MPFRYLLFVFIASLFFTSCLEKGGEKESIITYGVMKTHRDTPVMDIGIQGEIGKYIYHPSFEELTIGESYLVNYWIRGDQAASEDKGYRDVEIFTPPILVESGIVDDTMAAKDTFLFNNERFISSVAYNTNVFLVSGRLFITVKYPMRPGQTQDLRLYYNPLDTAIVDGGKHIYNLFFRLLIEGEDDMEFDAQTIEDFKSYDLNKYLAHTVNQSKADTVIVRFNYTKNYLKEDSTKVNWTREPSFQFTRRKDSEKK